MSNSPAANEVFQYFYHNTLGIEYWSPLRKLIDDQYHNIPMPFAKERVELPMVVNMPLSKFLSYLGTWSGVKNYRNREQKDPLEPLARELFEAAAVDKLEGNDPEVVINWPIFLYTCTKPL